MLDPSASPPQIEVDAYSAEITAARASVDKAIETSIVPGAKANSGKKAARLREDPSKEGQ
jgi:hypothetical protein